MRGIVRRHGLHTVCEEALCPNLGDCWQHGRATVMILGNRCTRRCGFCNVNSAQPAAPDNSEPARVAAAIADMKLDEVVLTSVTRDDLPDGGAQLWAETITRIRALCSDICIEALIPDFRGDPDALKTVFRTRPDILAHNLETVPSLYPIVRPQADYSRALDILKTANRHGLIAKTGIMVGLGESFSQVVEVMRDAQVCGCSIFTIGQYLQPSREHLPVRRYVEPAEFEHYRHAGLELGLPLVVSGPLVRSSYHSDEQSALVRRLKERPHLA